MCEPHCAEKTPRTDNRKGLSVSQRNPVGSRGNEKRAGRGTEVKREGGGGWWGVEEMEKSKAKKGGRKKEAG